MAEKTKGGLYLLTAIVERGKGKAVAQILEENHVRFEVHMMGDGTAGTEFLESIGIADVERSLVLAPIRADKREEIIASLRSRLGMHKPGAGILFTIPMTAVGGPQTLRLFMGTFNEEDSEIPEACSYPKAEQVEEKEMAEPKAELVITIVQRGYGSEVVESAARAGARGGTVLKGRASGGGATQKFFGIMVEPQKDVVLLVIPAAVKPDVMRAICCDMGLKTPGAGVSFSLPVTDVVGAYGFDDPDFVAACSTGAGKKKRRLGRPRI